MSKSFKLVLFSLGVILVGALGANYRLMPGFAGFVLVILGSFLAFAGAVGETVSLLKKRRVDYLAFAGFIPLLVALSLGLRASKFPRINDVSTDLSDVPQFVEIGNASYPEEFKPIVKERYADVTAQVVAGSPDEVMTKAAALLKARGYGLTREDRTKKELEGVAEIGFFHFKDDFVLRFRAQGAATLVDMRSKSRVGKGDIGANAARIREVLAALKL